MNVETRRPWLAVPLLLVAPATARRVLVIELDRPPRSAASVAVTRPARRRVRRAEDRPEGLRHPEEPREPVLHHRRQREVRRRDRRAGRAGRDRNRDQRHRGHPRLADPGHPGRDQQGRQRADRLRHRPDRAVPDAQVRDEARASPSSPTTRTRPTCRNLFINQASTAADRHQRGGPARQADPRHRPDRDRLGRRVRHEPERLDRVHEAGAEEVPEDDAGLHRLRQRRHQRRPPR